MTEQQLYTLLEMPSEAVEALNEAEGKLNLKELAAPIAALTDPCLLYTSKAASPCPEVPFLYSESQSFPGQIRLPGLQILSPEAADRGCPGK